MVLCLWWYHHMRGRAYDLFSFNKSLAIAQIVGLCLAVAMGPLSRFMGRLGRLVRFRRPICILAVVSLIAHGVISFFLLPRHFPWSYYASHPCSTILGLTALTGLVMLWGLSYPVAYNAIGPRAWKWLQLLTYPLLAAGVTHFVLLDKFPNWLKWFRTLEPALPPGTLLPFVLACLLVIIKLMDLRCHGQAFPSSSP